MSKTSERAQTAAGQAQKFRRGFPLVEARDSKVLEAERQFLRSIDRRSHFWQRWRGYWKLTGPGWVQSALTLGAGSAGSTILAGALFGYKLLWVQPVAMALGIAMFAAISYQTLITRARPYDVFWKILHPSLALLWGFSVLLASVVWQFPQYSLGTAVLRDIFNVFGISLGKAPVALLLLVGATAVCWSYGRGSRQGIRTFERVLKYFLYFMVVAFGLVVLKTGFRVREMLKGFFGFYVPGSREGISIVLGQLGAAVGVNMTFLYPYTLLARGWSREHLRLKNFDLAVSMFLPFVLATSFITIACANTLYVEGIRVKDAVDAAHALQPLVGLTVGRIVFSLGILSMCFTTMVIEMLIAGFVLSEMFSFELHGKAYRASTMLVNIGLLGAFTTVPFWVPVVTSSFNLLMMPVTYICFFVLQNKKSYLGQDVNKGIKGAIWNIILILAVLVVAAGAAVKILSL